MKNQSNPNRNWKVGEVKFSVYKDFTDRMHAYRWLKEEEKRLLEAGFTRVGSDSFLNPEFGKEED